MTSQRTSCHLHLKVNYILSVSHMLHTFFVKADVFVDRILIKIINNHLSFTWFAGVSVFQILCVILIPVMLIFSTNVICRV